MDVNDINHKVNRVKRLHTMYNYLYVQHQFQHTNQIIHINSRLQYAKKGMQKANTKLTSPYYMNYSHIIQSNYCEGTLRNFDPIKNYSIFSPLYAKTNRPILVPIGYLQCVEGGATKCTYGHTFNLLYRDWMADKFENRQPSQKELQIFNHLLELQPHCNADLYARALAACLARDPEFLAFFRDPDIRAPDSEFEYRTQATALQHDLWLTDPQKRDSLISKNSKTLFFPFFFLYSFHFLLSTKFISFTNSSFFSTKLEIRISSPRSGLTKKVLNLTNIFK